MLNIENIDKNAFQEVWNEILSVMQSLDDDKQALKSLKSDLGSVIGADNAKETNAVVKALLKKQKEQQFYDVDAVENAQDIWDSLVD